VGVPYCVTPNLRLGITALGVSNVTPILAIRTTAVGAHNGATYAHSYIENSTCVHTPTSKHGKPHIKVRYRATKGRTIIAMMILIANNFFIIFFFNLEVKLKIKYCNL
jgi:hypothetical protein